MARLQNALTKQLTDEHERVDLKLREGEESVRKIRQAREETGVQLYGVQHQLARMQTTFERTHDNYNIVQRYRTEAERQHEILQRQYEGKKEEADEEQGPRPRPHRVRTHHHPSTLTPLEVLRYRAFVAPKGPSV